MPSIEEITDLLREELDSVDQRREEVFRISRLTIRLSSEAIRAIHRRELDDAKKRLQNAREHINTINASPSLAGWGAALAACQEYVEAEIFWRYVANPDNAFPSPSELGVSAVAYLLGLADVVGELRRFALDHLRSFSVPEAEHALEVMDSVLACLVGLDYPEKVLPGVRRKTDMARMLVERTRAEITMAWIQGRLQERLDDVLGSSVKRDLI